MIDAQQKLLKKGSFLRLLKIKTRREINLKISISCLDNGVHYTQPGKTSTCPEIGFLAQNILSAMTANGEVFHPQGLTAAMTSTNSWNTTYRNKFVKVTNLSNTSKSIVVKVTDTAPANRGIELSYRAWVSIGKPSGANSVKIELMAN